LQKPEPVFLSGNGYSETKREHLPFRPGEPTATDTNH